VFITNGARQEDALPSTLFNLALEAILQKINIIGHIGTKSIQILAYADDVAVVGRNKNSLKNTLVSIESEARKRGLLINENRPSTWK
jgi:type IV secretory pathway VirB4 component